MRQCNAVFEGGGVRGIGHVGAVCRMEKAGYQFVNTAGSSAGAMVAALLSAGYSGPELKREMEFLDYTKFKGKDLPDYFGIIGKTLSLLLTFGIYDTDYLETWISDLLSRKHIRSFADIKRTGRNLKITASDLTDKRLLIFPDHLKEFGISEQDFPVAAAVRMSVSIPVFFEPVRWKDQYGKEHFIVDGGLLSNYPIWLLDKENSSPALPTFGFKFLDEQDSCHYLVCPAQSNIVDYLKAIISTCLDAVDHIHLHKEDYQRTICIPTSVGTGKNQHKINAVDFDISKEDSNALFYNGWKAADQFLQIWNFEQWKRYSKH